MLRTYAMGPEGFCFYARRPVVGAEDVAAKMAPYMGFRLKRECRAPTFVGTGGKGCEL